MLLARITWRGFRCRTSLVLLAAAILAVTYVLFVGHRSLLPTFFVHKPCTASRAIWQHRIHPRGRGNNATGRIYKEMGRDVWEQESQLLDVQEEESYYWEPTTSLQDVFWPLPSWGDLCSRQDHLLLVVLVTSRPQHFERREAIRATWARNSNSSAWSAVSDGLLLGEKACMEVGHCTTPREVLWKTVFLLGQVAEDSPYLARMVEDEARRHSDLLVGSYVDSYRNLSLKVVHGLIFTASQSPCKVDFALKTDDDCFVNIPVLLRLLLRRRGSTGDLYVGKVQRELGVIREERSKWFVSRRDFRRNHYPAYAIGTGYVLSQQTLQKFQREVVRVRPFPVEDAFTGVVLRTAGIRPTHSGRFTLLGHSWHWCNFLYLVVMHHIEAKEQANLMRNSLRAKEMCPQQKEEITTWD